MSELDVECGVAVYVLFSSSSFFSQSSLDPPDRHPCPKVSFLLSFLTLLHLTGFGKNATIPASELCSLITRKLYGYVNSNPYIF